MVVMNKGVPEQIGTPIEVFEKPASLFVASFIGSPPMNLIPVVVDGDRQVKDEDGAVLQFDPALVPAKLANRKVIMGLRPEHIKLHASGIPMQDRKSVVWGKGVAGRVSLGGRRIIK